jgi:pimeloyl-ACP methyl ester carboxylesterase
MAIQHLADQQPELFGERVRGVLLVSTALGGIGRIAAGSFSARQSARAQELVVEALLRSPRTARSLHRLLTGPLSHPRTAPLWRALLGSGPDTEVARTSTRDFHDTPVAVIADFYTALCAHDCSGRVGELGRVPTWVLVGNLDRYTTPVQARELAAQIPGAVVQTVYDHGHDLPYERPDILCDIVRALATEVFSAAPTNGRSTRSEAVAG